MGQPPSFTRQLHTRGHLPVTDIGAKLLLWHGGRALAAGVASGHEHSLKCLCICSLLVLLRRREVERRTHPLSKADFVLLEAELESWRQQQTAAIKNAGLVEQEEKVRHSRTTTGAWCQSAATALHALHERFWLTGVACVCW